MRYEELPVCWQRIFALEWLSLCRGSKAIAAVIADENGNILSEGRNMIGEHTVPNPATAHAETEAIRNLDSAKYPDKHAYTLYTGLEPCVMCMGTAVMGGIRKIVIAARDQFGGAMHLIGHSPFARAKNIQITWLDNGLGDMQRAFQTLRELLFQEDPEKLERMLRDFSYFNQNGVLAAQQLFSSGYFMQNPPEPGQEAVIFNLLAERTEQRPSFSPPPDASCMKNQTNDLSAS